VPNSLESLDLFNRLGVKHAGSGTHVRFHLLQTLILGALGLCPDAVLARAKSAEDARAEVEADRSHLAAVIAAAAMIGTAMLAMVMLRRAGVGAAPESQSAHASSGGTSHSFGDSHER